MRRLVMGAVVAGGLVLTGCSSDGGSPSSAVQSGASALASAANSLASAATSAAASAEAAASSALASVKGGLDAKDDVALGSVAADPDGKSSVPVTVTNKTSQSYKYTIEVSFEDGSGKLLDAAVVTVPEVAAGGTAQATAKSNRKLDGTVTAKVGSALRY
jgi:outer membrane murein-binding lipoprotein Lpp